MEELEKESESMTVHEFGSMERCALLLQDLRNNPLAEWFLEPVDHITLGLTDYPQVGGLFDKNLSNRSYSCRRF